MVSYDLLYPFHKVKYESCRLINHLSDKKLSYKVVNNGYVYPPKTFWGGGIFDSEKNFIKDTTMHLGGKNVKWEIVESSEIKKRDKTAVYLGFFSSGWGHCITDCLSRIWYIQKYFENEIKDSNMDVVFVCLDEHIIDNFVELLSILGIHIELFTHIQSVTQYDEIIIPDQSFFNTEDGTRYYTKEYIETIDQIRYFGLEHKSETEYEKIYFSYSKYIKNKVFGEKTIEDYFRSQGFKIIYPEDYNFKKQLNILVNCKVFASTIGSCSHNNIFLNNDATVILIPRAEYLTGYQMAINDIWDQDVHLIDSSLSIMVPDNPWSGPFYFYVSDNLKLYFQDDSSLDKRYWRKNFGDFTNYIDTSLKENPNRSYGCSKDYFEYAMKLYGMYLNYRNIHILKKIKKIFNKFIGE